MIGTDEAKLLESGSLVIGTVDEDGMPDAARAWGAWPLDGGRRIRLLVTASDERSIDNLRRGGRVAVNVSDPPTLKSIQLKGRATCVEPPTQADLELSAHYAEVFLRLVEDTDGTPYELLRNMVPAAVVAVEAEVEAVFDQTPGPTAGQRRT